MKYRSIVWFSCGVASAVAGKLRLVERPDSVIVRIRIDSEHPDNDRFAADCEKWYDRKIIVLQSEKYKTHFDVIEKRRYVNGPAGALCTSELKRMVREKFQQTWDDHTFGFDASEMSRAEDFRENNPGLLVSFPLIEAGLTKADCKALLTEIGIELPAMYRLGYANNNCIGCVKGGAGYWNRIREDFPKVFARMAKAERTIGKTILRKKGERLYLDQLDPTAGRFAEDQPADCGVLCQMALAKVGLDQMPDDGVDVCES